jgi:integrase
MDRMRIYQGGKPHDVVLGPTGSPEARTKYLRIITEMTANGGQLPQANPSGPSNLTVNEVLARWWLHAKQHYRNPDGSPKTELHSFRYALRPLGYLYGDTPAKEFGPLALKAVRQLFIKGYEHPEHGKQKPWSRKALNRQVTRIKTFFGWAESEQLVPPATVHALRTVRGLHRGHAGVKERGEVLPVPEADLEATLAVLNPIVRGLAEVQLWTGARPGEVVLLRPCDLRREDVVELAPGLTLRTGGKVWVYHPEQHKTAHRGHMRIILFGPKAQEVLRPFLDGRKPEDYLFSPREAAAHYKGGRGRKINHAGKRPPGEHYSVVSLDRAIAKACKRAGVGHFHPNQLRHNAATRLAKEFGPDVARIVLGHRTINTTRIYMVDDLTKAVDAVARLG